MDKSGCHRISIVTGLGIVSCVLHRANQRRGRPRPGSQHGRAVGVAMYAPHSNKQHDHVDLDKWNSRQGLKEFYHFEILALGPWVFLALIFLFIVNVIVATLVAREFCQKITEETPSERAEEDEKKTSKLPAVELKTEEELVTKKTGQEGTQEIPTTGAQEKTIEPIHEELVTEEERNKEDSSKLPNDQQSWKQTEEADVEMVSRGMSSPQKVEALTEKPEMESDQQSKPFYTLKAAITAMWLPAVVGDKKNLFLVTSLSTLITKILILLVSIILAFFFQENMHPHPFILWSWVGKMLNYR